LLASFLKPQLEAHDGSLIKYTGDGFLAVFASVMDAVACAIAMQRRMVSLGERENPDRQIWFRMGVHVCDTIVEDHDVFGEGVNVAARLQTYAEPGDIVISETVAAQLPADFEVPKADLGDLHLKNMTKPVHGYSLRIGSLGRRTVSPTRAIERLPSIAVMPFRALNLASAETYFTDGLVEDLVTALASLREVFVISRTSTLSYAGQVVDVRRVGTDLGVRYVLTGSIRRTSSSLQITTELADATSGTVIHAARHEVKASSFFDSSSNLALEVTAVIAPQVREWELRRTLQKHPESLDAYDLTLRGLHLLYRLDYDSFSRARGFLQQAIVADPSYAAPHAYAAHWHVFRVGQGWSPDPRSDGIEGGRLAAAAIDLDRHNALALALHGHTHSFILKQADIALGYFDRALAASPNCAMAWALSSAAYSYKGDGLEALERAACAIKLSPRDIHAFYYQTALTLAHYACGDHDAAVCSGMKAVTQNPSFCTNLRHTAASLIALGRVAEAKKIAILHERAQPSFTVGGFARDCPYQETQKRELFIERLRKAGFPG
jgi:adenylate cyclase